MPTRAEYIVSSVWASFSTDSLRRSRAAMPQFSPFSAPLFFVPCKDNYPIYKHRLLLWFSQTRTKITHVVCAIELTASRVSHVLFLCSSRLAFHVERNACADIDASDAIQPPIDTECLHWKVLIIKLLLRSFLPLKVWRHSKSPRLQAGAFYICRIW